MISPYRHRRRLLPSLVGLASLAFAGLAARQAHATWYCEVLDGPGSSYSGAFNHYTNFTSYSAVWWNGAPLLVERTNNSQGAYIRYGLYNGFTWNLYTLDSGGVGDTSALVTTNGLLVTYGTSSGMTLRGGPDLNHLSLVQLSPHPANAWNVIGSPSLASYLNTGFAFLASELPPSTPWGSPVSQIWYSFDAFEHGWIAPYLLDGSAAVPATSPSAVVYDGLLYLVYELGGQVVINHHDGSSWSGAAVVANGGPYPSAFVDTNSNTLHVLYIDTGGSTLVDAALTPNVGWTYSTVDTDVPYYLNGAPQAVSVVSGYSQIYYVNSLGAIRTATLINGQWTWQSSIDGPGSSCVIEGTGGTTDPLGGAQVAPVSNPATGDAHLFFTDIQVGTLRHAYWL
jgi:hypothetical protein